MSTVRINTSDIEWIERHAPESEAIPYGTDARGCMFFQVEVEVSHVERVTFAKVDMIRFDLGEDWPRDHTRWARYPSTYLVES